MRSLQCTQSTARRYHSANTTTAATATAMAATVPRMWLVKMQFHSPSYTFIFHSLSSVALLFVQFTKKTQSEQNHQTGTEKQQSMQNRSLSQSWSISFIVNLSNNRGIDSFELENMPNNAYKCMSYAGRNQLRNLRILLQHSFWKNHLQFPFRIDDKERRKLTLDEP